MIEPIGHVDFYPNGGVTQPGCKQGDFTTGKVTGLSYKQVQKFVGCDHERSYEYFTESISPSCPFIAVQCHSYEVSTLFNLLRSYRLNH